MPANVVTTPPGAIFRIVLFAESATYMFPELSTAMPWGLKNRAAVPVPLVEPVRDGAPATVPIT